MFEWITSPEAWVALATLTALETVLGIDNIIFISILSLSFLLLIGMSLIAESLGQHIPKPYIFLDNMLVMDYIGDENLAPQLKNVTVENPKRLLTFV